MKKLILFLIIFLVLYQIILTGYSACCLYIEFSKVKPSDFTPEILAPELIEYSGPAEENDENKQAEANFLISLKKLDELKKINQRK